MCISGVSSSSYGSSNTLSMLNVSFVRSVSMDTWQEEQIKRMQVSSRCTLFSS